MHDDKILGHCCGGCRENNPSFRLGLYHTHSGVARKGNPTVRKKVRFNSFIFYFVMCGFFFADIVLSLQLKLNPSFRLDKIQFFCRCRPIVTIRTKKPIASARSKTHRFDWNIRRFSQIKKIKRLGWNTTRRFVRIKNPTLQLDIYS